MNYTEHKTTILITFRRAVRWHRTYSWCWSTIAAIRFQNFLKSPRGTRAPVQEQPPRRPAPTPGGRPSTPPAASGHLARVGFAMVVLLSLFFFFFPLNIISSRCIDVGISFFFMAERHFIVRTRPLVYPFVRRAGASDCGFGSRSPNA